MMPSNSKKFIPEKEPSPLIDAIHPLSKISGINYFWAGNYNAKGKKMIDRTPIEVIYDASTSENIGVGDSFEVSQEIASGTHYDWKLKGKDDCEGGSKGIMDVFIPYLICRKLLADRFLPEAESNFLKTLLVLSIALPLEISRFGIGMALALLLTPFVALMIMFTPKNLEEYSSCPGMLKA